MKIIATITLKSLGGGYNTDDYEFESQKDYDAWIDKHNNDNALGKIIGIHREEFY
jgi:outer membrane protease